THGFTLSDATRIDDRAKLQGQILGCCGLGMKLVVPPTGANIAEIDDGDVSPAPPHGFKHRIELVDKVLQDACNKLLVGTQIVTLRLEGFAYPDPVIAGNGIVVAVDEHSRPAG